MTVVGTAEVLVLPSAANFGSALGSQVNRQVPAVGRSAGKTMGKSFGASMLASAKAFAGPMLAIFTAAGIARFTKDSVELSRKVAQVDRETAARVKATGGAARVTAGYIENLSQKYGEQVAIGHTSIQTAANLLLSFKAVHDEAGRGNKIYDRALMAALNISAAQKKSLVPTTIALGKALQDPVAGLGLLSRYGVTFTEAQKAMITKMVESGDTMKAQKFILDELNSRFKGVAKSQATGAARMSLAWLGVKVAVGNLLNKAYEPFANFMGRVLLPAVTETLTGQNLLGKSLIVLGQVLRPVLQAFGGFIKTLWQGRSFLGPFLGGLLAIITAYKAYIAITTAARAATIALNLAMIHNPIGLVIAALVALAIGLTVAYQKSATFRKIVDAAWAGIRKAVAWAWPYIKTALVAFGHFMTDVVAPAAMWLWKHVISPAFHAMGTVIKVWWNNWVKPNFEAWKFIITKVVGPVLLWLWHHVVAPAFSAIGKTISTVWNGVIKPVFNALSNFVRKTIPAAFDAGVNAVKRIWDGLINIAKRPINFIIGTIWNNGLQEVIAKIGGVFGTPTPGDVKTLAAGGPVTGGRKGRDSVPALLMPGEHVLTEKEVKNAGGHNAILRLRDRLREGMKIGDIGLPAHGIPKFASGGYISAADILRAQSFARGQAGKPYKWGAVGPGSYDCSGFQSAITNVLLGVYPYARRGTTATMPWAGFAPGYGQYTIGNRPGVHMGGTLGGLEVESTDGHVIVGSGARGASDPFFTQRWHLGAAGAAIANQGSMFNFDLVKKVVGLLGKIPGQFKELGNMNGFGSWLKDALYGFFGKAKDWVADKLGINQMLKMGGDVWSGFKGLSHQISSLFGTPNPFDTGGILRPGALGINLSGRPERVLDPQTTRSFDRMVSTMTGSRPHRTEFVITNWQTGRGYIRGLAADEIAASEHAAAIRRRMR